MRNPYETKTLLIRDKTILERAITTLRNAPIDPDSPIQVVIREEVKARKPTQNQLMWAGPMRDIAEQAWIDGRQYSAEIWHEHFKREFLPEEYDPALCKEGYEKWQTGIKGERLMIGSTTDLTVKGFSEYLEQVHAFGADLGVRFHANPRDRK